MDTAKRTYKHIKKELPESYSDESINYYRDAVYNYVSQHYGSVA